MPKVALVVCAVLAALPPGRPATPARLLPQLSPSPASNFYQTAEYPTDDLEIWSRHRDGLIRKLAARRLREGSETAETVDLLLHASRPRDAIRVLRRIVERNPGEMRVGFDALVRRIHDVWLAQPDVPRAEIHALFDAATRRLLDIPREEAAGVGRRLLWVDDRQPVNPKLRLAPLVAVVQRYPGTEEAQLAEIDLVDPTLAWAARLDVFNQLARRHGFTVAGARAMFAKGEVLASEPPEAKGSDPTPRLLQVLEVIGQLESGRYPECEWTAQAASLLARFSAADESYAKADATRFLGALVPFAARHFELDPQHPGHSGLAYWLTVKPAKLWKSTAEATIGIEDVLARIARELRDPAPARYLQALVYIRTTRWHPESNRTSLMKGARSVLSALAREDRGLYHRKALATLAALEFEARNPFVAVKHFRRYVEDYPTSDYAWLAALRIGQCEERLRNWPGAIDAYRQAALRFASIPIARVLGHAYAGRALESRSDFAAAVREYTFALEKWDDEFGVVYSSFVTYPQRYEAVTGLLGEGEVARWQLTARVHQLRDSLAVPGGALVERGRWLVDAKRYPEAAAALLGFASDYPKSPLLARAQELQHRARLEQLLTLPEPSAFRELESLSAEPLNFFVLAARLGRAAVTWKRGAIVESEAAMRGALREWQNLQKSERHRAPNTPVERDVAEIRQVVFRPRGGGPMGRGTQGDLRRTAAAAIYVVNPTVAVKHPESGMERITVVHPIPDLENVLFFGAEEKETLKAVSTKFGGTPRPSFVHSWTERPKALWDAFFPRGRSNWPDWDFRTYPVVRLIEFLDADRSRAAVYIFESSHSGSTVLVEKSGDVWRATGRIGSWIS